MHKQDVPWVMLIWNKYYSDTPPQAMPTCGSFWWRDVFSLIDIYRGVTTCVPRAGDTILLWKDIWISDEVLQVKYNHLFSFALDEDISLAKYHDNPEPASNFHLPLSLEARQELDSLNEQLHLVVLEPLVADEWITCWGDTTFKSVKFYKFYFRNLKPPQYITRVWKTKCMMRHKVFAWLMLMDRVNTRDMLCRRHFNIRGDHSCLLCNTQPLETNKHLFFECQFSVACWASLHIHWDTYLGLQQMFDRAAAIWSQPMFKEIIILAAWNIWKQRNKCFFDKVDASLQDWSRLLRADLAILKLRVKPELVAFVEGISQRLAV